MNESKTSSQTSNFLAEDIKRLLVTIIIVALTTAVFAYTEARTQGILKLFTIGTSQSPSPTPTPSPVE